jgi:uncharacterized membrane protein YoaK (UPF0700 family)
MNPTLPVSSGKQQTQAHDASPAVSARDALHTAALLVLAGGFWDGFTFFGHGHVFANVMTANMVLLGVKAVDGDATALRNLYPILAYLLGACFAQIPRLPRVKDWVRDPPLAALGGEVLFLFCAGWYPERFHDWPVVLGLSFFVAVQSSYFLRLEKWPYASTMPTGNLRNLAEGSFQALFRGPDPEQARRALLFGIISISFLAGAALGAFCVSRFHNKALWIPAALLLVVTVPIFREDRRSRLPAKS